MTVELLNPSDLASYKDLIDECFGTSNDLSFYERYSKNKGYFVFVVKNCDEIVGSITQYNIDLFTFNFQPSLMLFNIAVKPTFRKNGIARFLLEYIIENAKKDGYHSISLTCLEDAYGAHKLYESLGFKKANSVKYDLRF